MLNILASVTDKTGLDGFLKQLEKFDQLQLFATRSTADYLLEKGFACRRVEDLTGFPEILSGRVKTLHPKVFGGILARSTREDLASLKELDIPALDIVLVNLYAFESALSKGLDEDKMIEQIDIGGVALLRAAAKNFDRVAVICSPSQYQPVLSDFQASGGKLLKAHRRRLAHEAITHTSKYDALISNYLGTQSRTPFTESLSGDTIKLELHKYCDLRYGENPHQSASWFTPIAPSSNGALEFPPFEQLQGKELSSNNIADTFALVDILRELPSPVCCIIKHNNPCGVATGKTIFEAFESAYNCDPLSAFGGVYGFSKVVDGRLAEEITRSFTEIVLAPDFDGKALEVFQKKKNVRVLKAGPRLLDKPSKGDKLFDLKDFGVIIQKDEEPPAGVEQFKCVAGTPPDKSALKDVAFAWSVCKHLTSNAVFVAKNGCSLGFGIGQTSRVASVDIALRQAGAKAKGAVLASDAFFPAVDNIELAGKSGIAVIVQPGGSIKDDEVIAACNREGIAMLFTGQRCFKH